MSGGGVMRIVLVVLGRTVLELSAGTVQQPEAEHQQPQHIEDHTGYVVGFRPSPPVPLELDMPDRE
jgi:hypothetical protein